ncbi:FG-GAP-like repeat-containing protein [Nocardioides houyundeii]|uniref:FG-GAP-like repeat-containing protein n=1 Tax=Nocardioides houyundeii TaxID=2045452 RepID=UPI000C769CAD|nr:FG-GAP-like repeat-containing protein [Nocardioides houyundeii]
MPSSHSRFITATQQLLALGVVLAVLTPAAAVLSLDVVSQPPSGSASGTAVLASALVPTTPVDPEVDEYALVPEVPEVPVVPEAPQADSLADSPADAEGETGSAEPAAEATVTAPVEGYGAVGVTWAAGESVAEDALTLQVRTRVEDGWSEWSELEYHDDHAPDPGSPDAKNARPGTEPLIIGDVDEVQVRADASGELPADLSLSVVDPGQATQTRQEAPELETGPTDGSGANPAVTDPAVTDPAVTDPAAEASPDAITLQASRKAAQPTIFSRAQWGADESIRDKSSLRYGTITGGFVHHTVNANDYTADQVPGILRSIYAYHVKSRGWSDIGYNFLVDRFGRIWEGRYGGIDKAVVGAHTLNYNDYSFAMSAIGNFDLVQPSAEMLQAYGQLFGWKLGLHGVNPASTSQKVGRSVFKAISGHRDAGSTACPGKYLYAQLPAIRTAAAAAQASGTPITSQPATPEWTEAQLSSNLAGTPHPDLIVRRASDGRGLIIPTGGLLSFQRTLTLFGSGWDRKADALGSPDLTGDGVPDLVVTSRSGVGKIRPGTGTGTFARATRTVKSMKGSRSMTAVGDINGDGRNDLVSLARGSRSAVAYLGTPKHGFKKVGLGKDWGRYVKLIGVGDINTDGRPDLLGRDKTGRVWTRLGRAGGKGATMFRKARPTAGTWSSYNQIAGGQDYTGDGRPDLVVRARSGSVYVLAGNGDKTFGSPQGPVANLPKVAGLTTVQITGSAAPDLLGRRGGALVVIPNRGTFDLGAPIDTGADLSGSNLVLNAGDWDRDGYGDVLTREADGSMVLRRGNGQGQLAAPQVLGTGWGPLTSVEAVGDVSGDGFPDLIGTFGGASQVYRGHGAAGFLDSLPATGLSGAATRLAARTKPTYNLRPYDWRIPISDAQLGPRIDLVVREASTGRLYLINGNDKGLRNRRYLGEGMGAYDLAG